MRGGNKKPTALSVPNDPRLRKSFDLDLSDGSLSVEDGSIQRSNSCFELNDHMIIRVSVSEQEDTCNYKSIYVS